MMTEQDKNKIQEQQQTQTGCDFGSATADCEVEHVEKVQD